MIYIELNELQCLQNISKTILELSGATRGAAARGVTVKPTGCGFDSHSRR